MPSGSELVIVLVVLAVGVGLILLAARTEPRSAVSTVDTIHLSSGAHPWMVTVVSDLAGLPKHTVDWLSHDVAIVTWTRRSGWAILVAIFLFPVGLLALLFTVEEHGTIGVVDDRTVALGGRFSNAAVDAVNSHLPDSTHRVAALDRRAGPTGR